MKDIFELYHNIQILISATVRNVQTLNVFTSGCGELREIACSIHEFSNSNQIVEINGFTLEQLRVPMPEKGNQTGFFVPTTTAIEIFSITKIEPIKDPFAL